MDKNKRVYCTECKYFRIDDENIPYCPFEDSCDIYDCEDSRRYSDRPMYESRE